MRVIEPSFSRGGATRAAPTFFLPPSVFPWLYAAVDGLVVAASGVGIFFLHVFPLRDHAHPFGDIARLHMATCLLFVIAVLTSCQIGGLYRLDAIMSPARQLKGVVINCCLSFLFLVVLGFGSKLSNEISRVWAFSMLGLSIAGLTIYRTYAYGFFRRWAEAGIAVRNIVLLGAGEHGARFLEHLAGADQPWLRIVGVFDDRLTRIGSSVAGYPLKGTSADLIAFIRRTHVDEVIIALPWSADQRLAELVDKLRELPVSIRLGPDLAAFRYPKWLYGTIGNLPVLDIAEKPLEGWRFLAKGLEDKLFATAILLLFLPLMLVIAIAIKLDSPGPVLFRQRRFGFNNQIFWVNKFRTMHADCSAAGDVTQARRNDPRTTRVGRLLRRTSLDELPQLFNVLEGTMSLVGPRPHAIEHNEEYAAKIAGYFARHRVKPGITGWAQVHGFRGETQSPDKMRARIEHDLEYIENWSIALDIYILVKTLYTGFFHSNAY